MPCLTGADMHCTVVLPVFNGMVPHQCMQLVPVLKELSMGCDGTLGLQESLRKYTVVPVVTRRVAADDAICGCRVPAGTYLACCLQARRPLCSYLYTSGTPSTHAVATDAVSPIPSFCMVDMSCWYVGGYRAC